MSSNMLVRKISLCHLHAVKLGLLWHLLLQKSQYTIQALQLGKRKPPDFNTITEHASSKPGEEAELQVLLPPTT